MLSVKHYLHTCDAMDSSGSTLPTSCIACIWKTAGYQCSLRNFPWLCDVHVLPPVGKLARVTIPAWPPPMQEDSGRGFGKKWLMLAVMEEGAKAGKEPLGRVVINLADFASDDGRAQQVGAGQSLGISQLYMAVIFWPSPGATSRGSPVRGGLGLNGKLPATAVAQARSISNAWQIKTGLHGRDSMF